MLFGFMRDLGTFYTLRADYESLRGLNALEEGDVGSAHRHFQAAIDNLFPEDLRLSAIETGMSPMLECSGYYAAVYWLRKLDKPN